MLIIEIVVILLLIGLSALFSGSETAFFSLSAIDMERFRHSKNPAERRIYRIRSKPQRLLIGILAGNMLVNIAISSEITRISINLLGGVGIFWAVITTTAILLIFGEVTPKSLAVQFARRFAAATAPLLTILLYLLFPIRWLLERVAFAILPHKEESLLIGEGDFRASVEILHTRSERRISLQKQVNTMFEAYRSNLESIFTPAVQMPIVNEKDIKTLKHKPAIVVDSEDENKPVGVIASLIIRKIERCIVLPETISPIAAYRKLLESGVRHIVTIDEYGAISGYINLFTLATALFSQKSTTEPLQKIGKQFIVAGQMPIVEVASLMKVSLESESAKTIGGLIEERTGRIPTPGESITLDEGIAVKIISCDDKRIIKVALRRMDK